MSSVVSSVASSVASYVSSIHSYISLLLIIRHIFLEVGEMRTKRYTDLKTPMAQQLLYKFSSGIAAIVCMSYYAIKYIEYCVNTCGLFHNFIRQHILPTLLDNTFYHNYFLLCFFCHSFFIFSTSSSCLNAASLLRLLIQ